MCIRLESPDSFNYGVRHLAIFATQSCVIYEVHLISHGLVELLVYFLCVAMVGFLELISISRFLLVFFNVIHLQSPLQLLAGHYFPLFCCLYLLNGPPHAGELITFYLQ